MTPTHQTKDSQQVDVIAWQFLKDNPVPGWVFRNYHDLGGGRHELTARDGTRVQLTNWIVRIEVPADCAAKIGAQAVACVFTDKEFQECFRPLPPKNEIAQGQQV